MDAQKNYTLTEARELLKGGAKLTHHNFSADEYIYQKGNIMFMEDGASIDVATFWKDRNATGWENGWFILPEIKEENLQIARHVPRWSIVEYKGIRYCIETNAGRGKCLLMGKPGLEISSDSKVNVIAYPANLGQQYMDLYNEGIEPTDLQKQLTQLKELNAELLELKNSFYMDICRAYNAGKESMNKQHVAHQNGDEGGISLFVSSHEYFVSEFPTFKTNVP